MTAPLNKKLESVEWGEFRVGDLFEIENTLSFNADKLTDGDYYDYVTRTSQNQGILRATGFVNQENINPAGVWSLGLLQMDFFYRKREWYAGQFVRKIIPLISIPQKAIPFVSSVLNKLKSKLLSVLVRDVDDCFRNSKIRLPIKKRNPDFAFMEEFIDELQSCHLSKANEYLKEKGLVNTTLTKAEEEAINRLVTNTASMKEFSFQQIFNQIKQGRRLKKEDQIKGCIPFVMAGISNTGVVGYISNPVAKFPANSITIDIFGNTFYRNYDYGAGDDTGVYWSTEKEYSDKTMLYFANAMQKSVENRFSYGNKLRSSQSLNIKMYIPIEANGNPDYDFMENLISAVQKLVIRDVVSYVHQKMK